MTVTAIILAHYLERVKNIDRISKDLNDGSVKPDQIIVFWDDFIGDRKLDGENVYNINSEIDFLPNIRFAIGSQLDTDYCFFIDDDLSVNKKTLYNFMNYAKHPDCEDSVLGLEGSILKDTPNPYADDTSVNRGVVRLTEVDIVIRTYFAPTRLLAAGLQLRAMYPDLPKKSLDDVFLSLGNKYLNNNINHVIPCDEESNMIELDSAGVGQSISGEHYENRNKVCRFLMDQYE